MDWSCFIHCIVDEKKLANEFKGQVYFSQGNSISCRVILVYYKLKPFTLVNQSTNETICRVIETEAKIDDAIFILIDIYNSNIEMERLTTYVGTYAF